MAATAAARATPLPAPLPGRGFPLLLGEQFGGGGRLLQPVEIQMDEGMGPAVGHRPLVVLGQGEGGARDRLVDPQRHGQTLHQAGLAGPQFPLQHGGGVLRWQPPESTQVSQTETARH